MNALYSWTAKWQLTIAVDKCCVLHIGKANPISTDYFIDKVCIPVVSSCRDLGVTITNKCTKLQFLYLWRACCYFIILSVVFPDGDRSLLVSPSDLLVC